MTIVGFEIRDQGNANILVFDPTFQTPSVIKHATATKIKKPESSRILKVYRKDICYLKKYQAFELLKYAPSFPLITSLSDRSRLLPPGIPFES